MQNYESLPNRPILAEQLPQSLSPKGIVEEIAAYELSAPVIDLITKASAEFFASNEFAESTPQARKEMTTAYRALMDVLTRIQEYERRTLLLGVDFWASLSN